MSIFRPLGLALLITLQGRALHSQASPPRDSLTPRLAEAPLGTQYDELNAAFTPDGRTVYFTRKVADRFGVILVAHRRGAGWTTPEVAPFSGRYADFDPFISPDGSRLYWISNRPVDDRPKTDFDIWMVERQGTAWSAPIHLDAPVNSGDGEFYPTVAANGTLYFSSNRAGGKGRGDLYSSRPEGGRFAAVTSLGDSVNSTGFDGDPYIAPDESYLIFTGWGRPGGDTDGDLYITTNSGGAWSTPRPLGHGINSEAQEYAPIVSPDGRWLYFSSYRSVIDAPLDHPLTGAELTRLLDGPANGHGSVYRVPIGAIR
jgi:Tol biopolymer transport system component